MQNNPNALIAAQPGGLWIQRAVGVAALLVGVALAVLFAVGALKLTTRDEVAETTVLIFIAIVGVLAALFLSVGLRMTLNRPNRYGSLLTPGLWFLIAALFLASSVAGACLMVAQGRFAILEASVSALLLAALAALAGRRTMKKREASGRAP